MEDSAAFEAVRVAEVDDLPRRAVHGTLLPHVRVAGGRVVLGVPHRGEDEVSTGVVRGLLPGIRNISIRLFSLYESISRHGICHGCTDIIRVKCVFNGVKFCHEHTMFFVNSLHVALL